MAKKRQRGKMMKIKEKQSDDVQVLTLDGKLTIQNVNELKTVLVKSFDSIGNLKLNLKGITEVDLFCFQLLCSTNMTAVKLKKPLEITGINTEPFKTVIEDVGYSHHTGCNFDCNKNCLWVDGSESK
jgi:ABC-type transporter Mla MlaB component